MKDQPEMSKHVQNLFNKIIAIMVVSVGMVTAPLLITKAAYADDALQAKWVGDLPIMPQLQIEKNLGFAFDTPEGRIVTIYLSGGVDNSAVQEYYEIAMPPLGWSQEKPLNWHREGDHLAIIATTTSSQKLWKITIRPK